MHILYLDESGSPDADHFIVAGPLIHWSLVQPLKSSVDELIERRVPGSKTLELHASQMRTGRRRWSRVPRGDRTQLTRDIALRLSQLGRTESESFTLVGAVADRSMGDDHELVQWNLSTLLETCGIRLSQIDADARFLVVADETRYETQIQRLAQAMMASPDSLGSGENHQSPLLEPPIFADSRMSRMLQLADFAAHWLYRAYEHDDDEILNEILPAFVLAGDSSLAISHLTADAATCDCVACRSRR